MSKFAKKIHANPKLLANTSISVTLKEAKSTFVAMKNMSKYKGLTTGERAALRDCVEVTDDSVYELRRSMDQMDQIDEEDVHFEFEISNVQTWVSAALTDYTTCMDGFYNVNEGNVKAKVSKYAVNVLQLSSIALTFINRYATSG
ncbi:21 kDa protein-like [Apium graveolens]|uniref:21 kDa protein-like n=1 Tax=Apium graveolens TaxID=4045 RepID=UPI003D7BEA0C